MTAAGAGPIVRAPGRMTAADYVGILENHLLPYIDQVVTPGKEIVCMHDNGPIHTAKVVRECFAHHRIILLDWPARSPDVNPIENIFGFITNDWDKNGERNPQQLQAHVEEVWRAITPAFCANLCNSMPRRLEEINKRRRRHRLLKSGTVRTLLLTKVAPKRFFYGYNDIYFYLLQLSIILLVFW